MAETSARTDTGAWGKVTRVGRAVSWALCGILGLTVAAHLLFFASHATHSFSYPYPLDYGEGPLLGQVNLLRAGTPIWRLYADPAAPPYAVVNYPPVYHALAALVALPFDAPGGTLLAGRLVSLAATVAAVVALWHLSTERGTTERRKERNGDALSPSPPLPLSYIPPVRLEQITRLLIVLAFLALPIVREWAVVMRVDMLGVSLGLWGLLIVQRNAGTGRVLWAALPLTLGLLVKPSLLAAPAAALLWLFFRDRRRALLLALAIGAGGGLAYVLLESASGGWFTAHVLAANLNEWQPKLAYGFWRDQMIILWPLVAAGVLGGLAGRLAREPVGQAASGSAPQIAILLPLYYTLLGAIDAYGVGKVGAYTNYFLEFYAGLIWLAASTARPPTADHRPPTTDHRPPAAREGLPYRVAVLNSQFSILNSQFSILVVLLVIAALLRYYPTWSANYLKLAGIIEQSNPPRIAFGRYGVWQDLRRERDILDTLGGVNAALVAEVRAAGAPIFTDVPGVAAQAGQLARLQAFEHRQLLDAGLWDQRALLRDLANGQVPLVVLDYLGNWLTPEMIALITHRYGQEGSRGTYDLYRPVDPGPPATVDLDFPTGLRLAGYHLRSPLGRPAYDGGDTVLLTLDWRRTSEAPPASYEVVAQLTDEAGQVLLETTRPLLYGAFPPAAWPDDGVVQHMQPIVLPPELPTRTYRLAVTLRAGGRDLAAPRTIAVLPVQEPVGRILGDGGYFVPAPLLEAWQRAGGYDGPGDPLMPAVPFPGATLQCFARACLRLEGTYLSRLPLGELIHLADVGLRPASAQGEERGFPQTGLFLRGDFLAYWNENGGVAAFGPPISAELIRGDRIVQYTRYARLERALEGEAVQVGNLGEEFLRLPGGVPYRWP